MQVFIGLGSNLDNPAAQLQSALAAMRAHAAMTLICCSPLYRSIAVGPPQPDYVNAVAELDTSLNPEPLLDALQAIENDHGRVRTEHWGARTLDLDLLLYGDATINTQRLTVPHPWMTARNFVLRPLCDIAPNLVIPGGDAARSYLADVGDQGLVRLDQDN
ncbi:2-amino-4-hydroxy-6-hydroxymethyldihydropteridine diphosphokinase [Teredinibacter turnerae]|uniref:2-amino-4-hydroxy-6- hydroxymethyldihydropteridine diphosphokinase n=1 Tax=Teredinibacter turnerae TaxID=2426 RepID=UPI000422B888|nr:2-amino-4-hydroxy-6-hydroxymethyldihydropteridine diphosphokinase [Teredinibacter turnerae]